MRWPVLEVFILTVSVYDKAARGEEGGEGGARELEFDRIFGNAVATRNAVPGEREREIEGWSERKSMCQTGEPRINWLWPEHLQKLCRTCCLHFTVAP